MIYSYDVSQTEQSEINPAVSNNAILLKILQEYETYASLDMKYVYE